MTQGHKHVFEGLAGTNPLQMLAALGTFRLLALVDPGCRMEWIERDGTFRPRYRTEGDEGVLLRHLAGCFGWEAGEETGKRTERLETLFPVVVGRDVIKRPVEDFRKQALEVLDGPRGGALPLQDELLAAFGSDGVADGQGEIHWSLFSFSNGGSGKYLLKDFRNCACWVTTKSLENTLKGQRNDDPQTSLCWDPSDFRSYAHQYGEPGDRKNRVGCDGTVNALAFLGLCLLPSFPAPVGLHSVGITVRKDRWIWPLWLFPLGLEVCRSLLASRPGTGGRNPQIRWFQAERFSSNKRFYFRPSTPWRKGSVRDR